MSLGELASRWEKLVHEKKATADREKSINEEISALEKDLLEEMGLNGLPSIKTESGMTIYRRTETFVSKAAGVTTERLCAEMAQHKETADLVALNYNANSLRSRYKELIESEETLPPAVRNLLNVTEQIRLGYRSS